MLQEEIPEEMKVTLSVMQRQKIKKLFKYEIQFDQGNKEYTFRRFGEKQDMLMRAKLLAEMYVAHNLKKEEPDRSSNGSQLQKGEMFDSMVISAPG